MIPCFHPVAQLVQGLEKGRGLALGEGLRGKQRIGKEFFLVVEVPADDQPALAEKAAQHGRPFGRGALVLPEGKALQILEDLAGVGGLIPHLADQVQKADHRFGVALADGRLLQPGGDLREQFPHPPVLGGGLPDGLQPGTDKGRLQFRGEAAALGPGVAHGLLRVQVLQIGNAFELVQLDLVPQKSGRGHRPQVVARHLFALDALELQAFGHVPDEDVEGVRRGQDQVVFGGDLPEVVDQVGDPVEHDHGLARPRAALHHQIAGPVGADDAVLLLLDGLHDVRKAGQGLALFQDILQKGVGQGGNAVLGGLLPQHFGQVQVFVPQGGHLPVFDAEGPPQDEVVQVAVDRKGILALDVVALGHRAPPADHVQTGALPLADVHPLQLPLLVEVVHPGEVGMVGKFCQFPRPAGQVAADLGVQFGVAGVVRAALKLAELPVHLLLLPPRAGDGRGDQPLHGGQALPLGLQLPPVVQVGQQIFFLHGRGPADEFGRGGVLLFPLLGRGQHRSLRLGPAEQFPLLFAGRPGRPEAGILFQKGIVFGVQRQILGRTAGVFLRKEEDPAHIGVALRIELAGMADLEDLFLFVLRDHRDRPAPHAV